MALQVLEIVNIVASADWWWTSNGENFDPVCLFALTKTFDDKYPSLGSKYYVVGLSADELGCELEIAEEVFS